jgi:hypothetical protein
MYSGYVEVRAHNACGWSAWKTGPYISYFNRLTSFLPDFLNKTPSVTASNASLQLRWTHRPYVKMSNATAGTHRPCDDQSLQLRWTHRPCDDQSLQLRWVLSTLRPLQNPYRNDAKRISRPTTIVMLTMIIIKKQAYFLLFKKGINFAQIFLIIYI